MEGFNEPEAQPLLNAVDSPEERELLLSGLVAKQQGTLKVRNRIYELIFDRSWISDHITDS